MASTHDYERSLHKFPWLDSHDDDHGGTYEDLEGGYSALPQPNTHTQLDDGARLIQPVPEEHGNVQHESKGYGSYGPQERSSEDPNLVRTDHLSMVPFNIYWRLTTGDRN